jgi:hypothetical protein
LCGSNVVLRQQIGRHFARASQCSKSIYGSSRTAVLKEDVSQKGRAWATLSSHLIYQDLSVLHQMPVARAPKLAFGRLLDLLIAAGCTDSRDKFYALLGLIPTEVASLLRPDYTLSLSVVYINLGISMLSLVGSWLDMVWPRTA